MNSYHWISGTTTLVTVDTYNVFDSKIIVLPSNLPPPEQLSTARMIYLKETTGLVECFFTVSAPTGTVMYPSTHQLDVVASQCLILQETPTNSYNLLNGYPGITVFSTMETVPLTATPVLTDGSKSILFVDLQTESKVVLLPPIVSLSAQSTISPYFLIKDIYGSAYTNPLFLSTVGGASIDGLGKSIGLHYNYASIELAGDVALNRWHILNYYDGI